MSVREEQRVLPVQETDPDAQRHIAKVQAEHDDQYLALRRRAQGLFAALKGRTGIRTPEEMEEITEKTWVKYDSGAFLVERLGTSRFLDPELICVLIRLRNELLAEVDIPTAADRMNIDMAVLAYRNSLRIQSLINSSLMETERQLFGQNSLQDVLGQVEAAEVSRILAEIEQKLIPLLEKSNKMMIRALDRLSASCRLRGDAKVHIGVAGQVNVSS